MFKLNCIKVIKEVVDMNLGDIQSVVDGIPLMTYNQALQITSFIKSKNLNNILELGFAHGVSSCYITGILDEMKTGHLTTIDLEIAKKREPNIEYLIDKLGLSSYITIYYEPKSYIWRLMKLIEQHPRPIFDFCFIDGAHDWYTDGFAFFLVDKLLRPGGWILFDDINWTFNTSPSLKNSEKVQNMPPDERKTAQIGKVFELLVKPHPQYHNFKEIGNWAYAQKKKPPWDEKKDYEMLKNQNIYLQDLLKRYRSRKIVRFTDKILKTFKNLNLSERK